MKHVASDELRGIRHELIRVRIPLRCSSDCQIARPAGSERRNSAIATKRSRLPKTGRNSRSERIRPGSTGKSASVTGRTHAGRSAA